MHQLPSHADKSETSKIKKVNLITLAYAKLDYYIRIMVDPIIWQMFEFFVMTL